MVLGNGSGAIETGAGREVVVTYWDTLYPRKSEPGEPASATLTYWDTFFPLKNEPKGEVAPPNSQTYSGRFPRLHRALERLKFW